MAHISKKHVISNFWKKKNITYKSSINSFSFRDVEFVTSSTTFKKRSKSPPKPLKSPVPGRGVMLCMELLQPPETNSKAVYQDLPLEKRASRWYYVLELILLRVSNFGWKQWSWHVIPKEYPDPRWLMRIYVLQASKWKVFLTLRILSLLGVRLYDAWTSVQKVRDLSRTTYHSSIPFWTCWKMT